MSLERFTRKEVVVVAPSASLLTVAELMRTRHVGAVVVAEERRPVGIITDRDLALRAVARGLDAETPVGDIMSREVLFAHVDDRLDDALTAMRSYGVRRLPIVDEDGTLRGLVALDDLLVLLAAELSSSAEIVLDNRGP
jgi:CBS domain-containing protein